MTSIQRLRQKLELLGKLIRNIENKMVYLHSEGKQKEYEEMLKNKTLLSDIIDDLKAD